jgi:uncharacterized Zn-finger protein
MKVERYLKDKKMKTFEKTTVNTKKVSCEGNGALGHPKVYLDMGAKNEVVCPYCSKKFVLKKK